MTRATLLGNSQYFYLTENYEFYFYNFLLITKNFCLIIFKNQT